MDPTISSASVERLVKQLTDTLSSQIRSLSTRSQTGSCTLAELEQALLPAVRELAASLLSGLASLAVPQAPQRQLPCSCGQLADYQRLRPAKLLTIFGPISLIRPYYLCRSCQHGFAPLDASLQFVAGSRSDCLDELLALLGATHDSFAQAAHVLERLTLVQVCPNTVRDATEQLGAALVAHQSQAAEPDQIAQPESECSAQALKRIPRLYISMDGVQTHLRGSGWNEMKVGCIYHTKYTRERDVAHERRLRIDQPSYCASLAEREQFEQLIWSEARRRGVERAEDLVVIGDGSHWIWGIAERQFCGATQILDWYHASSYIWEVEKALWGGESEEGKRWATSQLDLLWQGQVDAVLNELERHSAGGEPVTRAVSYYTNQRSRMDYPSYRARGMQIGSGSIESACKQLVTSRLKQAGMIWSETGAEEVVTVRAWLKSGRWEEALGVRPARHRGYERVKKREAGECRAEGLERQAHSGAETEPVSVEAHSARTALAPEVRERVRAELAAERAAHPWRKPWSRRQQAVQHRPSASAQAHTLSP